MIAEGVPGLKMKIEYGEGKFDKKTINIGSWNINGLRAIMDRPDFVNYFKNSNVLYPINARWISYASMKSK